MTGTLSLSGNNYILQTAPHIRFVAARLFPGVKVTPEGLTLHRTAANTENLLWLLLRYPHEEGTPGLFAAMRARTEANQAEREQAAEIIAGRVVSSGPARWAADFPLRDYQNQALALARLRPGLLIGDDLGLGKTATALGIIADRGEPALVVCDRHLQRQWEAQVAQFCPALRVHRIKQGREYELPDHDVTLCTYSKLSDWADRREWSTVVYDEVQSFRHEGTGKYNAAVRLAARAGAVIGLSATPVYNYAGEIYNVMQILAPGQIGDRTEFFREWGNDRGRIKDPEALGAWLRELGIFIRRRRRDVGKELPPVQWINHTVDHSQILIDRLRGQANQLAEKVLNAGFTERGTSARQLDIMLRQTTGIAKAPFVADFVRELVEGGEQILLAGWHREVYTIWQREFSKHGIPWAMFTGSESEPAKAASVKGFMEGERKVLMMSLRSGAGLDGLQKVCRTVVVGELDWSPQVIRQLVGRVNRDGQTDPVTVFSMISEAGADPIMASVLGKKLWDSTALTDPDQLDEKPIPEVEVSRIVELARAWLSSSKSH